MKIGIDFDEVTVNFMDKFLEFYNQKNQTNFCKDDFYTYDFWKILGGSRWRVVKLIDEFYNTDFFDEIEFMSGAKEGILQLSENHDLSIITARPKRYREKTDDFIQKHLGGVFLDVCYLGFRNAVNRKAKYCQKTQTKLIIEDNKNYALSCAKNGIDVYLFDSPWNKSNHGEMPNNLTRVYNWNDILKGVENRLG